MDVRSTLRQALRTFRRNPMFTTIVVVTLAIGIGGNSAIFTLADATLLRPLPYPRAGELVVLDAVHRADHVSNGFTLARYELVRDRARSFAGVAVAAVDTLNMSGAGNPQEVAVGRVSGNFFETLGVPPALGRLFEERDGRPESPPVAVLDHTFWRTAFGSDSTVIGRTIRLGGVAFAVVGVAPPGPAPFLESVDLWIPRYFELSLFPTARLRLGVGYLTAVARLRPGESIDTARAEMNLLDQAYAHEHQNAPDGSGVETAVTSLREAMVADLRLRILLLSAAVLVVLLIACANAANLLLSRALTREREIAMRMALGASRGAIAGQLLAESVLLALAAGVLGLALGWIGVGFASQIAPAQLARVPAGLDPAVALFTVLLSIATGIAFGLVPAIRASRAGTGAALRTDGGWSTRSRRPARTRDLLVVVQIALSLVLLVAAGLLVRSLSQLLHTDVGFDPQQVVTMSISLPTSKYASATRQVAFFDQVLRRVAAVPGARSAALSSALPPMKKRMTPMLAEGDPEVPLSERPVLPVDMVSPHWFATLGIPLRAGRVFTEADVAASPRVVVVNEAFARQYWRGQNPIGKHVTIGRQAPAEVVGVTGNVANNGLAADVQPQIYVPFAQLPWSNMNLAVKTAVDPAATVSAIRQQVLAVDAEQPISAVSTADELLGNARANLRFTTVLLAGFSLLALGLALVGLYGVLAYSVAQRQREFAIRAALGATAPAIVRLVFGRGCVIVAAGLVCGLAGSLVASRLMASLLYKVRPVDAASTAAATVLFAIAASVAMYLPARRASATDVWSTLK